jgi:hypothetical protein
MKEEFQKIQHDGYRIHRNPDKSFVFCEGKRHSKYLLTQKENQAMNACFKRRGLFKRSASDTINPRYSRSKAWEIL